jgi:DNA-directed RNA polymerase specialized sigma24 family protein
MNAEDFARLLARLDSDPVRASQDYERLRHRLVKFFRRQQHSLEADDLADKALDQIAEKPTSYAIRNVSEFAMGVARYLSMESLRKRSTAMRVAGRQNLEDREQNPEHQLLVQMDAKCKEDCFLRCLEKLKPEERWLILEYYPTDSRDLEGRRRRLTEQLGVAAGALTSRMNRLRMKLERCCQDCYAHAAAKTPAERQ